MLVLRKTVRQFSAGTRVRPIRLVIKGDVKQSNPLSESMTVEGTYTHVDWYKDFNGNLQQKRETRTVQFEVESNMLVELRNHVDEVPAVPRINRPDRVARRKVYEMVHNG